MLTYTAIERWQTTRTTKNKLSILWLRESELVSLRLDNKTKVLKIYRWIPSSKSFLLPKALPNCRHIMASPSLNEQPRCANTKSASNDDGSPCQKEGLFVCKACYLVQVGALQTSLPLLIWISYSTVGKTAKRPIGRYTKGIANPYWCKQAGLRLGFWRTVYQHSWLVVGVAHHLGVKKTCGTTCRL